MLKAGDMVDIVAPSYGCAEEVLAGSIRYLARWQLRARAATDIFGQDPICAASDSVRFRALRDALYASDSQCVWVLRGGYGAGRIVHEFLDLPPPDAVKLFVGMSDCTSVHTLLHDRWGWSSVHAPMLKSLVCGEIAEPAVEALEQLLFGRTADLEIKDIEPLNAAARKTAVLEGKISGGNLSIVQSLIGTRLAPRFNSFVFLEDVSESPYRIDRMLAQLSLSGTFARSQAILLGTFTEIGAAVAHRQLEAILVRFASETHIPVFSGVPTGHGREQLPLSLNTPALLRCNGQAASLSVVSAFAERSHSRRIAG
jgi:muramoyltetrapeptide carboxypeptidase